MSLNVSATSYPVRYVTSEHKVVPQKMYFLPCTNQLKQSVTSWQLKLYAQLEFRDCNLKFAT
jgi:hypothetical protein